MGKHTEPETTEFVPVAGAASDAVAGAPGQVTVTVLEGVTVVDGPEGQSVYRYDIPADGIAAGWALPSLIEQIRQLQRSPSDAVVIDAEPEARAALNSELFRHGLGADDEVFGEDSLFDEQPAAGAPLGVSEGTSRRTVLLTVAVSAALILGGVAYNLIAGPRETAESDPVPVAASTAPSSQTVQESKTVITESPIAEEIEEETATSSEPTAAPAEPAPPEPVPSTPAPPPPSQEERHTVGPVSVATEAGAQRSVDGIWTTFTGSDPHARYHVVVQPFDESLHADWHAPMENSIANNPNLQHTGYHSDVLTYLETPGDGSQSRWRMQTIGNARVSLVCQTQFAQTEQQSRDCARFVAGMRVEGTTLRGSGEKILPSGGNLAALKTVKQ